MRRFFLILLLLLVPALGFWAVWPALSGYRINEALKAGDAAALAGKIDFERVRVSLRPAATAEAEKRLAAALAKAGPGGAAFADDLKKQLLPKIVDGALAGIVTPDNLIRIHREGGAVKDVVTRIVGEQIGKGGGGLGGLLSGLGGASAGGGGATGLGGVVGAAGGAGAVLDKLGGLVGGRSSPVRDITGEAGAAAPAPAADRPSPVRDITSEEGGTGAPKPAAAGPSAPATKSAPAAPEKPSYGLANIKTWGLNGPLGIYVGVAKDPAAKEPDVTAELSFTGGEWKLTGLRPRM